MALPLASKSNARVEEVPTSSDRINGWLLELAACLIGRYLHQQYYGLLFAIRNGTLRCFIDDYSIVRILLFLLHRPPLRLLAGPGGEGVLYSLEGWT